MRTLVLIAHNIRSCHNVGSLLRTADGLAVSEVICTGYTPYPLSDNDPRMPHIAAKTDRQIHKTALDAEKTQRWSRQEDIYAVIADMKRQGFTVAAVEQAPGAILLPAFRPEEKLALIVGREVEGIEPEVLKLCDHILEIPMFGKKESFNVAVAAAMALYHCRCVPSM